MTPFLDANSQRAHKARNTLHSALLVGGLGLLTGFSAWLIWGGMGVAVTLVAIGVIYAFAPRLPPEVLMSMYRARPLDPRNGGSILHIVDVLSDRAELPAPPSVYVIPSMTLNAFATGTPQKSMIGSDGRTAAPPHAQRARRRAGARDQPHPQQRSGRHEPGRRHDALHADAVLSRAVPGAVQPASLSFWANSEISFIGLLLLYLAPTAGSLIQLALSRTREYDADLEGAGLTGDPASLASALEKLERYQGHFWEDMMLPVPGRRIPQPSLLRSHPLTQERVARLRALQDAPDAAAALHRRGADGVAGRPRPHRHAPALSLDRRVVLSWPCRDLTS